MDLNALCEEWEEKAKTLSEEKVDSLYAQGRDLWHDVRLTLATDKDVTEEDHERAVFINRGLQKVQEISHGRFNPDEPFP